MGRRRQEDRSKATRDALIAAAIECIADAGYAETTTTLIAARAKVSRGALQHHFASREDLIEAVIDRVMAELHFGVDIEAIVPLTLADRVELVVDNYQRVFGGRLFIAALHIWLGIVSETALKERMQARLRVAQRQFATIWKAIFHDVDLDEDELMRVRRVVMATVRGYAIHRLFGAPAGNWAEDGAVLKRAVVALLSRPSDHS